MTSPFRSVQQMFNLIGKVGIVTGGGSGIGQTVAKGLAAAGAQISVVDLNLETATITADAINRELSSSLNNHQRMAIPIQADVTKIADVQRMVDTTIAEFGDLHIALNNAGIVISGVDNYSETVSERDWNVQMDVNINSVFRCCQIEAQHMIKKQYGRIINTASMSASVVNWPQKQTAYNTSKAAVVQMTKSLAVEWAYHNIFVNCISPGYTLTDLTSVESLAPLREKWIANTPLKRMCTPAELVGAVIYLSSDSSSFTTGSEMVIDGAFGCW